MNKKLILPLLVGGSITTQAVEKPNIILIYIDDMGYADPACFGGTYTPTPNIDKIATEGIRFSQYYSACPISSPSRTGVTTGMYPTRWGITTFLQSRSGNANAEQNDFLDNRAPSVARVLKENGYATGHFGKWHMGGGRDVDNAPYITTYGFDEYKSTWESPDPDPQLTSTDWIWADSDNVKRWNRTAYFVDKTLAFLSKNKEKPCYINLWPDDVHTPWVENDDEHSSPDTDWQKATAFTTVLKELDVQIGRLMQGIKDLGLDEKTLVIFTSDNGPSPSFSGKRTNYMRGQKATLYEGGIRMPLILRWPNHIAPNQLNSTSVICAVDLMPSFCAMTGAILPDRFPTDGEDRSSILLGGANTERAKPLFWEFGKTKNDRVSPHIAVREGDWKLLVNADGTKTELYNLKTDVKEATNVASSNATVVNRLKPMAISWFNSAFRQFADLGTSTNNATFDAKFRTFPNPVTDFLQIHTSLQDYRVEILGIDGKKIITCEQNAAKVDLTNLRKGIYILSIENNGVKYFKKIIKE